MKTRTLTIIVIVLAVLLVLALAFLFRQGTSSTATPPPPTVASATSAPQPITDIVWEWTGMQDASGDVSVSSPKNYTIIFNTDGSITGQADCNQISGTYSVSGSSLSIQLGASTSAYCGEQSQDQLYKTSLSKVTSYAADQKGLELHFSDGKMDFRDGGPAR